MATLPTPEECARLVLEPFSSRNLRAGNVLQPNTILGFFANRNLPSADLRTGYDYAVTNGWIAETPGGGVELLEKGFAEM